MTKEQIEELLKHLKDLGITRDLLPIESLVKLIDKGEYHFKATIELPYERCNFVVRLYFFKDGAGVYSLTRYDGTTLYESDPEKTKSMVFYCTEFRITLRQAFNLLEGRAIETETIYKANAPYRVWLRLNFGEIDSRGIYKFRRFRSGAVYNLEKALSIYPIDEMRHDNLRQVILQSLKLGNAHPVTLSIGGKKELKLISANPENRQVTIMAAPDGMKLPINGTKIPTGPILDDE